MARVLLVQNFTIINFMTINKGGMWFSTLKKMTVCFTFVGFYQYLLDLYLGLKFSYISNNYILLFYFHYQLVFCPWNLLTTPINYKVAACFQSVMA